MSIQNVFIANRGEIACRVARTCQRLGLVASGLYSDADAGSLHRRSLDLAIAIGGNTPRESYLDVEKVITAALEAGADAVHPGYGFLSENADFAEACAAAGLIFIGPPADAIRRMGSKAEARALMIDAGVAVLPGYQGEDQSLEVLRAAAADIRYPVLIKAASGGGGRGMRIVGSEAELEEALASARREARAAFGDDRVILEKFLTSPRHIEVQVLADSHGKVLHLFERDCSAQRRYQKVIEEAPAPFLSGVLRESLHEAAVNAAAAVNYVGAGTVEFIVEDATFAFMEMNTRLQVEHPVTEAITGIDLVEWQIRVAAGEPLPWRQSQIERNGHAFEARVYAESPEKGFLPSSGELTVADFPMDVRIDAGVEEGDTISTFYDPMIAKVIVHAEEREAAREFTAEALGDVHIAGVETNVAFLGELLRDEVFVERVPTTRYLDEHLDEICGRLDENAVARRQAAVAVWWETLLASSGMDAWDNRDGFRLNQPARESRRLLVEGQLTEVVIEGLPGGDFIVTLGDSSAEVLIRDDHALVGDLVVSVVREGWLSFIDGRPIAVEMPSPTASGGGDGEGQLTAPMPGQVIAVHVQAGDVVERGQALMVVEAMKMEHTIRAPADGTVEIVEYAAGDRVDGGAELLRLTE